MEKVKILGIRWVDMDGDRGKITGYSLYTCFPADKVEGLQTAKAFVSASAWAGLSYKPVVNDEVIFIYNRNGKVFDIRPASQKDK